MDNNSKMIIYTTEDGLVKIETTFNAETVWLSLDQMSSLFQRDKSTISRHIKNIYEEGELVQMCIRDSFKSIFIAIDNTIIFNNFIVWFKK